jgi:hypothetical protein
VIRSGAEYINAPLTPSTAPLRLPP